MPISEHCFLGRKSCPGVSCLTQARRKKKRRTLASAQEQQVPLQLVEAKPRKKKAKTSDSGAGDGGGVPSQNTATQHAKESHALSGSKRQAGGDSSQQKAEEPQPKVTLKPGLATPLIILHLLCPNFGRFPTVQVEWDVFWWSAEKVASHEIHTCILARVYPWVNTVR